MSLFQVRDLRVLYDTPEGQVEAVDRVSLDLERGEWTAIVGESGSGKSSVLHAVLGLLPSNALVETGAVHFEQHDLLAFGDREWCKLRGKELAFVPQGTSSALHPLFTVGEQLADVLMLHEHCGRARARERATEGLAAVGFAEAAELAGRFPHQLSGGMRQRALIAMALLCRPKVLLLDEPTTALDATLRLSVMQLFDRLRREQGLAIVMVTHDLGLVAGFADRVLVMYAGRLVEHAATLDLFVEPWHPYTQALLESLPSIALPVRERLATIGGQAPDLVHLPPGCAFHPRCTLANERCGRDRPELSGLLRLPGREFALTTDRRAACFEKERLVAERVRGGGA